MEESQPKNNGKKRFQRFRLAILSDFFDRLLTGEEEKDYFAENLAMLMNSGMSIVSVLDAAKSGTTSGYLRRLIDKIKSEIDAGSSLWRALEKSGILPLQYISLIRIGEESGRLPQNLKVVALQRRKDRIFRSKIKSAAMYPILVFVLTFIVGIAVAWFTLPRLATVFSQLNLKLPFLTIILIAFGKFLGAYGVIAVPLFVATLTVLAYFVFFFKRTRNLGQTLLLHLPGAKNLIQKTELARLGYTLGSLLDAGVPIVESLNSLESTATFYAYKKFYKALGENIGEGASFKKTFGTYPGLSRLIPAPVQELLMAAEESGRLPETLLTVGKTFEDELETATKDLTTVLEPILLVIVWLGVVSVAIAVILPIYSLIGGLSETSLPTQAPTQAQAPTPTAEKARQKSLRILRSELGFVRVRDNPSLQGKIIDKASSGKVYQFLDDQNGWYEIVLEESGKTGWVSGRYSQELNGDDPNDKN